MASGNVDIIRPAVEIHLDQRNIKVVKKGITAEYTVGSVPCLVPTTTAKHNGVLLARLRARPDLQPNKIFLNTASDQGTDFYGVWCNTTYSLTADVLELEKVPE